MLISLLTFGGTLLLVVTGLLNFSVFVRTLRATRDQLETARLQLENARGHSRSGASQPGSRAAEPPLSQRAR